MLGSNPVDLTLWPQKRPKLSHNTWVLLVNIITGQLKTTSRFNYTLFYARSLPELNQASLSASFALCCKSLCKVKLQNTTNMTTVNPAIRSVDEWETCCPHDWPILTDLNLPLINRFHKLEADLVSLFFWINTIMGLIINDKNIQVLSMLHWQSCHTLSP